MSLFPKVGVILSLVKKGLYISFHVSLFNISP